jgi:hypothetical protein
VFFSLNSGQVLANNGSTDIRYPNNSAGREGFAEITEGTNTFTVYHDTAVIDLLMLKFNGDVEAGKLLNDYGSKMYKQGFKFKLDRGWVKYGGHILTEDFIRVHDEHRRQIYSFLGKRRDEGRFLTGRNYTRLDVLEAMGKKPQL